MADIPLAEGEEILAIWRPQLRFYLVKILIIALITTLILGPLHFSATWQWFVSIPSGVIFYLVMFDDFQDWFRHRKDEWILTNERLIFISPTTLGDTGTVSLAQIKDVKRWMVWTIHVRLMNGQVATINYMSDTRAICAKILATRDLQKGQDA